MRRHRRQRSKPAGSVSDPSPFHRAAAAVRERTFSWSFTVSKMSPQTSQLLDALRDLGLISTKFRAQSAGAEERFSAPLSKLASTVQSLDVAKAAKPVHCPEEYLR